MTNVCFRIVKHIESTTDSHRLLWSDIGPRTECAVCSTADVIAKVWLQRSNLAKST